MSASDETRMQMDRRGFLARSAAGALGMALVGQARAQDVGKSRVVVVRDAGAVNGEEIDAARVDQMLERAMAALIGSDAPEAWQSLFAADDVVGIKGCVMMNPVHAELLYAIHAALAEHVGVADESIMTWDRNRGGIGREELLTTPRQLGYHDDSIVDMVHDSTALINCPGLKRHWLAGIGGAVKNWCGAVRGINPQDDDSAVFKIHGDSCAEMGLLNAQGPIRDRCRLVIIDALSPCYGAGPQTNPADFWPFGGLIVSTDPVAADVVGVQILEAKLEEVNGRATSLNPPAKHLQVADQKYGLGQSDPSMIEVVEL